VGRNRGHPRGDLTAASGEIRWPPTGRIPWPPSGRLHATRRPPVPTCTEPHRMRRDQAAHRSAESSSGSTAHDNPRRDYPRGRSCEALHPTRRTTTQLVGPRPAPCARPTAHGVSGTATRLPASRLGASIQAVLCLSPRATSLPSALGRRACSCHERCQCRAMFPTRSLL
jgi:hypothetical protein